MRTRTPTVSSVSSLVVAAALAVAPIHAAWAAPDDEEAEEEPEGEEGEGAEGEEAEGETPEGEEAEGETPEGEEGEEGEMTPEEAEAAAAAEAEAEAAAAAEAEAAAAAEAEAAAAAEAEAAAAAEAEAAAAAEAAPPSYVPEDDGPEEPMIAGKPATGKGLMIAGGAVTGVGLGATIAFSLMTRNCSYDGPLQCGLQNQDDFFIPLSAATLLTGTMLLGVGVGYHIRYKRWKRMSGEKATAVVPTTLQRGAGLAWVGRF